MKKTFSFLPVIALFMLLSSSAFGQVSEIKFQNNSNCPVIVEAIANDSNCRPICSSGLVSVPANTLVSIQIHCTVEDRNSTLEVQVMDNQSTAVVGSGCGLPFLAPYLDCSGAIRTLTLIGGTFVAIN